MASDDPIAWLRASGAQGDVIDGLRGVLERAPTEGSRWHALWTGCPRGDWLLGIAARLGVEKKALVGAALACARSVVTPGERELEAAGVLLDRVEAWQRGEATEDDVRAATSQAEAMAERASSPATAAAFHAALAVGMGAFDDEVLAGAAGFAAESLMMATLDCGMPLVMSYAHGKGADAVRAAVPWSVVADRLRALGAIG